MKLLYFLVFLLISGTSLAQDSLSIKSFSKQLSLGEVLEFGDRSIKFKQLVSDSRCPRNPQVTCIWAGEAEVLVEVFENGISCGTETLTVSAGAVLPAFLQDLIPGQQIFLDALVLSPYPTVPGGIDPEDYRLNLEVKVMAGE